MQSPSPKQTEQDQPSTRSATGVYLTKQYGRARVQVLPQANTGQQANQTPRRPVQPLRRPAQPAQPQQAQAAPQPAQPQQSAQAAQQPQRPTQSLEQFRKERLKKQLERRGQHKAFVDNR